MYCMFRGDGLFCVFIVGFTNISCVTVIKSTGLFNQKVVLYYLMLCLNAKLQNGFLKGCCV